MRLLKQLGMAAAARSASGSVNARWMPGLLPSIPTGFGSGSGPGSVVGIGGYHTETEVGRYWTLKKVFEANLKGGVVHECSYHWLKRSINVVPCFEIPKMEEEKVEIPKMEEVKELEKLLTTKTYILLSIVTAIEVFMVPIPHKLLFKVNRENIMRRNKKGAVLHAYQFSWLKGVKLTPILNLSGRADLRVEYNPFLFTFKQTPIDHE